MRLVLLIPLTHQQVKRSSWSTCPWAIRTARRSTMTSRTSQTRTCSSRCSSCRRSTLPSRSPLKTFPLATLSQVCPDLIHLSSSTCPLSFSHSRTKTDTLSALHPKASTVLRERGSISAAINPCSVASTRFSSFPTPSLSGSSSATKASPSPDRHLLALKSVSPSILILDQDLNNLFFFFFFSKDRRREEKRCDVMQCDAV